MSFTLKDNKSRIDGGCKVREGSGQEKKIFQLL